MITKFRTVLRLSVYLLIVACSQSALETYGCACASREYSVGEIAKYRAGAERNEPQALAEMEEYHSWRRQEHAEETPQYQNELKQERSYRNLRLVLNDANALEAEVDSLIGEAIDQDTEADERFRALEKARDFATRHPTGIIKIDYWDPKRGVIDALKFIDRELPLVRKFGAKYYATRRANERTEELRLKRSQG